MENIYRIHSTQPSQSCQKKILILSQFHRYNNSLPLRCCTSGRFLLDMHDSNHPRSHLSPVQSQKKKGGGSSSGILIDTFAQQQWHVYVPNSYMSSSISSPSNSRRADGSLRCISDQWPTGQIRLDGNVGVETSDSAVPCFQSVC